MDNSIVKVNEIPRVEWRNERVVTTTQLAAFYECSAKHIQQNYNNNVDRFVNGKHFYRLEGDALRAFKHDFENFELAAPQLNLLYLWTKRGAARHAKMLNTDRAWAVFEALEDNYFNRLENTDTTALTNAISELAAASKGMTTLANAISKLAIANTGMTALTDAISDLANANKRFTALTNAISELTAAERENLDSMNSEDTMMLAKVQLLIDLAATTEEKRIRSKLVRAASNLVMGDDFFK